MRKKKNKKSAGRRRPPAAACLSMPKAFDFFASCVLSLSLPLPVSHPLSRECRDRISDNLSTSAGKKKKQKQNSRRIALPRRRRRPRERRRPRPRKRRRRGPACRRRRRRRCRLAAAFEKTSSSPLSCQWARGPRAAAAPRGHEALERFERKKFFRRRSVDVEKRKKK